MADVGESPSVVWEVAKLVASGVIGGSIAFWFGTISESIKAKAVHRSARIEETINSVHELCEIGSQYWCLPANAPEAPALEGKVSGLMHELFTLVAELEPWARTHHSAQIDGLVALFYEAVTGGDFGVMTRQIGQPAVLSDIWRSGVQLKNALRSARDEEISKR